MLTHGSEARSYNGLPVHWVNRGSCEAAKIVKLDPSVVETLVPRPRAPPVSIAILLVDTDQVWPVGITGAGRVDIQPRLDLTVEVDRAVLRLGVARPRSKRARPTRHRSGRHRAQSRRHPQRKQGQSHHDSLERTHHRSPPPKTQQLIVSPPFAPRKPFDRRLRTAWGRTSPRRPPASCTSIRPAPGLGALVRRVGDVGGVGLWPSRSRLAARSGTDHARAMLEIAQEQKHRNPGAQVSLERPPHRLTSFPASTRLLYGQPLSTPAGFCIGSAFGNTF